VEDFLAEQKVSKKTVLNYHIELSARLFQACGSRILWR